MDREEGHYIIVAAGAFEGDHDGGGNAIDGGSGISTRDAAIGNSMRSMFISCGW